MAREAHESGVVLAAGQSGTRLLHELLLGAAVAYADDFAALSLPSDLAQFRTRYPELLPRFEALRLASPHRREIARALCQAAGAALRYVDGAGERSLREALSEVHDPLPLVRVDLPGAFELTPRAEYRGRTYVGPELMRVCDELARQRLASDAALEALGWAARAGAGRSALSLAGKRFVVLGAAAELSPVYTLLEAGAEVLWLDCEKPAIDRLLEPRLGGVVHYAEQGADLLREPGAVRATVLDFARGRPIHLLSYAFAQGEARALRLGLAMNELAQSLVPGAQVVSLCYLLSPTAPSPIAREDAARADERAQRASAIERALLRTGQLAAGHVSERDQRVSCAVVAQQGASFQLHEYVAKRLAAEAFSSYGLALTETGQPKLFVSANMAPVSATRSLASPLLEAALLGTPSIGMLIAEPSTSRDLAALLTMHDLLHPDSSPAALFARQIHGGVHALPYALEGLIRMAALRGIAHRPKLAFELWR